MSQQDLNEAAPAVYIQDHDIQSPEWYQSNIPHSKTLMENYALGFGLSYTDFQRLKNEIYSSPPLDLQSQRSHKAQQCFLDWASEFYKNRFVESRHGNWLIQAILCLKRNADINTKKRKRADTAIVSLDLDLGEAARQHVEMWR